MNKFSFKQNKNIDLTGLEVQGQRIILKSISHGYAETIFNEFTPEITRYRMPRAAEKIDETIEFIQSSLSSMHRSSEIIFVILDASSEEFLGCCGFHGREDCQTPELGIWIKVGAHGNGYGRETIYTLCRWAVQNVEFEYAIYPVDRANTPSRRIPESLGGTIYHEAIVETMSGSHLDEVTYKIPLDELKSRLG